MASAAPTRPVSHSQDYSDYRKVDTRLVETLVGEFPGRTSHELSKFANKCRMQIARRLPEAARMIARDVFRGPRRECQVTGRTAQTWWDREVPQ